MVNLFCQRVKEIDPCLLNSQEIATLQVNLGYACNMGCMHCHVRAIRASGAVMDRNTMDAILHVLEENKIGCLDITGGAPELNADFRYFVRSATRLPCNTMVRTNLTIFFEPGMEDLPSFYAEHGVELIASLPCYTAQNVDAVRGAGTFEKSINALQELNRLGYGIGHSGLRLNLVYNPGGAFFPSSQLALEREYKDHLGAEQGILFDRLYVISNVPLGGFKEFLFREGALEDYITQARNTFNPGVVPEIMCRHIVNVGPDGTLYDCDFNQVSGVPVAPGYPRHIGEFDLSALLNRPILFKEYCWICAAGSGSTCTGAPDPGKPS
jgi:radical SAM/Cys-rich protein